MPNYSVGVNLSAAPLPAGVLDATFGGDVNPADGAPDGFVVHDGAAGGSGRDFGDAITTDAAGNILVAGRSFNGVNEDLAIWRYSAAGALDATFGGDVNPADGAPDGFVVHDGAAGGSGNDFSEAITTDAAGNILVAGSSRNGAGNSDLAIWRYSAAGALDTTFGGAGFVVHDGAAGGSDDDFGRAITTDGSGNILVAGSSRSSGNGDMAIWRYTAAGALDTTFGAPDGFVVHDSAAGGSGADIGFAITTDGSGNILVAGSSSNGAGNRDLAIWRYR